MAKKSRKARDAKSVPGRRKRASKNSRASAASGPKKNKKQKRRVTGRAAGGAATGGGINFQSSVTTIVAVHMARGRPLNWLEGLVDDTPIAMLAETGGAGDDLQIELRSSKTVEVQVKQGLIAGDRLWQPLEKLATALANDSIGFGILAVSSSSSATIRQQLAKDIIRIGDGRQDNLSGLGLKFLARLENKRVDPPLICSRLRIVTVFASPTSGPSVTAARSELSHLCREQRAVGDAWNRLYRDSTQLIELRGRRTASSVVGVLQSSGIDLSTNAQAGPVALLPKLTRWTSETAALFSVLGASRPLSVDRSWIPLNVARLEDESDGGQDLGAALKRYHSWDSRDRRSRDLFGAPSIGRFIKHVVVVAGPGMGKTVLLKKLARIYSQDGFPVLRVSLAQVANRMRTTGHSFVDCLFSLGLAGFEIPVDEVQRASFSDWVLLCDGLDECGADQEAVVQGLLDYVAGHPQCRIIATTRPVGYRVALLHAWRHYEIASMETGDTNRRLADLIADILPDGSAIVPAVTEVAAAALKSDAISSIVGRSPLLLGMSAVILAKGQTLGVSKSELYICLFKAIDEAKSTQSAPVAPILHRFLNILGWQCIAAPLAQTDALAASCATILASELGVPPLRASELTNQCISHWQAAGVIERVHHGNQQTLTFIHKTFGEFAAARSLVEASPAERARLIEFTAARDEWVEVLNFAGRLGLSSQVIERWLAQGSQTSTGVELIARAIGLSAEAEPPPNPSVRKKLIEEAFGLVAMDRPRLAYRIGDDLIALARRFPDEVGPASAALLDAPQCWTRVVAFACAAIAGAKFFPIDRLIAGLGTLTKLKEDDVRSSLAGGMKFGGNTHLLGEFMVAGAEIVLELCDPDTVEKRLVPVINDMGLHTYRSMTLLQTMLKRKGRTDLLRFEMPALTALGDTRQFENAIRIAFDKMLRGIVDAGPATLGEVPTSSNSLHVSAFFQFTQFMNSGISDMWAWRQPYDAAAAREVFRGIVKLLPIDQSQVVRDAQFMLDELKKSDGETFKLWHKIASVDLPEVDEGVIKSFGLDVNALEASLYHRSSWFVRLGAYLLANAADKSHLQGAITRLLANGEADTLWATGILLEEIGADVAVPLLCQRLTQPTVVGCRYLFEALIKFGVTRDSAVIAAVENGIMTGDAETAVEAATLAEILALPDDTQLCDIVERGYAYWLDHEQPYPTEGGVVSVSPRSKLLRARLKIEPASLPELFDKTNDERPDVVGVAKEAMQRLLNESANAREAFADAMENDTRSRALLLRAALEAKCPFAAKDVARLAVLLNTKEPRLRFAALGLLDERYMAKDEIIRLARTKLADGEQDIRERAYQTIEQLSGPDQ